MSSSEREKEEEGGFYRIVEGEINYEWVYCALIRRDAALPRENRARSGRAGGSTGYERRHTQTVQMVMMAFMSRLRWAIALGPV